MIGRTNIGGGSNLNFQIKQWNKIEEEYVLPESEKENTILVQTEIPISSWSLSYSSPANPVQGTIWIQQTNDSSNILLIPLRKKLIVLYIYKVLQYINNSWQNVTSYIYQTNQWIQIN